MAANNNIDNLDSEIINFSLKGADNKFYSPDDFKNSDLIVIIFMCNHCPYVKDVIKRFVKFQEKYKKKYTTHWNKFQ